MLRNGKKNFSIIYRARRIIWWKENLFKNGVWSVLGLEEDVSNKGKNVKCS